MLIAFQLGRAPSSCRGSWLCVHLMAAQGQRCPQGVGHSMPLVWAARSRHKAAGTNPPRHRIEGKNPPSSPARGAPSLAALRGSAPFHLQEGGEGFGMARKEKEGTRGLFKSSFFKKKLALSELLISF